MSLYGALITGVSGLTANSQALSIASSNIANVNTVGYKADNAQFSTLLASVSGTGDSADAGVQAITRQNFTSQGLLTTTGSATDLGISGNGFFAVSQSTVNAAAPTSMQFTRAGNFTPDATGNLKNAAGLYLLGWPLDQLGNPPTNPATLSTINVNNLAGKAEATTVMNLQANLQASDTADASYAAGDMTAGNVTPQFQRTINVFDSQGGTQPLEMSFEKTGANTWAYEITYQGNPANIGGAGNNPIAQGTMAFNSDGSLATADTSAGSPTGSINITIPWDPTSGLNPQTLSINMGTVGQSDGITQFDTPSALVSSNVDGAVFGSVTGMTVDTNGYVSANFSNGLTQKIFKIPLVTFTNPDGLSEVSGNAFTTTPNSGTPTLTAANTGGAGEIESGELEGSTVDLATEFTNLIVTQRAYSASSRIVTTTSNMLDDLLSMAH